MYGLNKYSVDGKVRSKEVLKKNIAKAIEDFKKGDFDEQV